MTMLDSIISFIAKILALKAKDAKDKAKHAAAKKAADDARVDTRVDDALKDRLQRDKDLL
jgi:hypothetical protein